MPTILKMRYRNQESLALTSCSRLSVRLFEVSVGLVKNSDRVTVQVAKERTGGAILTPCAYVHVHGLDVIQEVGFVWTSGGPADISISLFRLATLPTLCTCRYNDYKCANIVHPIEMSSA